MKKIVLFSDGTGNSASSPHKTNVWRAYQALDTSSNSKQIAFYDNGVGTSSFRPLAILGLAFGWGLARNVKQIYGFLCRCYEPGDEIHCFGFSRGAFTMRVAVGLITKEGIIDKQKVDDDRDLARLISAAYRHYREKTFAPSLLSFIFRPVLNVVVNTWHRMHGRDHYDNSNNIFQRTISGHQVSLIKFVGVWDTVDAYGLPVDELTRAWDKVVWPLTAKDRNLSGSVEQAFHALALDEKRESFEPMLWNEESDNDHKRITQVWFPGVHANVGGGYPDDSLAYVSLDWMLHHSRRCGLTYNKKDLQHYSDYLDINGPLYDNRAGVGNAYRYAPRNIDQLCDEERYGFFDWLKKKASKGEKVHSNSVTIRNIEIHQSVLDRIELSGDAYAPINLPEEYKLVDDTEDKKSSKENNPIETPAQAKERRAFQSYVWNKVWCKKLVYFGTILSIILFISFPYIASSGIGEGIQKAAGLIERIFGPLSYVFSMIPVLIGKVPGMAFTKDWLSSYQNHPEVFSIFLIVISFLLILGWELSRRINNEMYTNWHNITKVRLAPSSEIGKFRKELLRFRESSRYKKYIKLVTRDMPEAFAILFLACIIIFTVFNKALYSATNEDCSTPSQSLYDLKDGNDIKDISFLASEICHATGINLQENQDYVLKINLSNDWRDASIDSDLNGWKDTPIFSPLLIPHKRHWFINWYQIVARIEGEDGKIIPLKPDPKSGEKFESTTSYDFTIRPQNTGQLFLYVNDAVIALPKTNQWFYKNNTGHAMVTIRKK